MTQINLAPGTQYIAAARRRRQALYLMSGAMLVVLLVVWLVFFFWQKSVDAKVTAGTADLQKLEVEIKQAGDAVSRIKLFEGRLTALDQLLDNHMSWGGVLGEIERLLPPQTVLTSIDANQLSGIVSVQGRGAAIDLVALTLASFRSTPTHETLFTDVTFTDISRKENLTPEEQALGPQYIFAAEFNLKK